MSDPYKNKEINDWLSITNCLIEEHPLSVNEIEDVVLKSWSSIFNSTFGEKFKIGNHIFPKPQILGFLLHELIPLELNSRYSDKWRGEQNVEDKDIVYIPNEKYSIEVKTSSNPKYIFGNRSYSQSTTTNKKSKDGYYLTINFGKVIKNKPIPKINIIRFGWINSTDWIGQKSQTGQQSRLNPLVYEKKLRIIHQSE
jgi:hypothetical protein